MLSIPYLSPNGPTALRFRRPPWKDTGPKYWQPEHSDLTIFNTKAFFESEDTITITEGEMDCMTLVQAGIPAVGLPGASSWKSVFELIFEGYTSVVICADNDDKEMKNGKHAGREFASRIAQKVPGPKVILMPLGHDINSYFVECGREALRDHLGLEKV